MTWKPLLGQVASDIYSRTGDAILHPLNHLAYNIFLLSLAVSTHCKGFLVALILHFYDILQISSLWSIAMKPVNQLTVKLNTKGQITIPRQIRQQLGIQSGDEMEIHVENTQLVILPKSRHKIESIFGILKAKTSVSLEEMEMTIRYRATHCDRN
jgi:AbrB family looped-hinge helix DNA binding protein